MPAGRGGISAALGTGASSASHCATRGEVLSGPQSSDLEKKGNRRVPEALPALTLCRLAKWYQFLVHLFASMITNSLRTPASLLSRLLIPISLFKYNLVFI